MFFKKTWPAVFLAAGLFAAELPPAELLALGLREMQTLPRFTGKEVSLNFTRTPPVISVETANYTIRAEIRAAAPSMYIKYSVLAGEKLLKAFRVKYDAAVWADVYYADRHLVKGEEVAAEDFYLRRTDILKYSHYLVENGASWNARVMTTGLRPDEPLFAWMLSIKQLVNSGDIVALSVSSGSVTIKTAAKALQHGLLGDKIMVQVQNDKKRVLQAEITGSGECQIIL
ncbi:MAG: flagellar basal body P-ring formation chaperone FlgA [Candidatus Margulisbacteria bacterium]|jgi:flagella basal body P-ring formation protein FlgA|nr:flagellar basal body P-ring formation chaperone FlgA [Candidatus Margulisiibacteriota bacterium]